MEFNKVEVALIADATAEGHDQQIQELSDLQLALVGGGAADVVFG